MSINTEDLNDTSVAQYLAANPEFFTDKDTLLMSMVIPHESGQAISLLERQVNLLRERSNNKQKNIENFIANAKANDELFEKVRTIILDILKTSSYEELSKLIERRLKDDFSASVSSLKFVTNDEQKTKHSTISIEAAKEALGETFDHKRSFCSSLASSQADILFPGFTPEIVSVAVIPVHIDIETSTDNIPGTPLLVIGSDKEHQFHSSLDTLFLDFIGEVLSTHIVRLLS